MTEYAKPDIDEAIERRKASVLLLEERLEFEQIRLLLLQRARERGILLKAIGWSNQPEARGMSRLLLIPVGRAGSAQYLAGGEGNAVAKSW